MATTVPVPGTEALTATVTPHATPLWTPPSPHTTRTHAFIQKVNAELDPGANLRGYADLYDWSVGRLGRESQGKGPALELGLEENTRSASPQKFWSAVWDETGVVGEKGVEEGVSLEVSRGVDSSVLDPGVEYH